MEKFQLKFNLGRGKHHRWWQIRYGRNYRYFNPQQASLLLEGCLLSNRVSEANKIYRGSYRTACAWIKCDRYRKLEPLRLEDLPPIFYNPKIAPYWRDERGNNIDSKTYKQIVTVGDRAYILEK